MLQYGTRNKYIYTPIATRDISIRQSAQERVFQYLRQIKDGQVLLTKSSHFALKRLRAYGDIATFGDIRGSVHHACDIQRLLIYGLIEPIKKECGICPHRGLQCLGRPRRCSRRWLYKMTLRGSETLANFGVSRPLVDEFWVDYFQRRKW